ncbi:hypothetical protein MCERE19_03175 [Spirosomataceae bacterium]
MNILENFIVPILTVLFACILHFTKIEKFQTYRKYSKLLIFLGLVLIILQCLKIQ